MGGSGGGGGREGGWGQRGETIYGRFLFPRERKRGKVGQTPSYNKSLRPQGEKLRKTS